MPLNEIPPSLHEFGVSLGAFQDIFIKYIAFLCVFQLLFQLRKTMRIWCFSASGLMDTMLAEEKKTAELQKAVKETHRKS